MRNVKTIGLCFILSVVCIAASPSTESDDAARIITDSAELKKEVAEEDSPTQIEDSIRETHSVEEFKAFGLWDAWQSGNLGRQK